MSSRKKTIIKKTAPSRSRVHKSKLAPFAPFPSDREVVRPVGDIQAIRLEWASVLLGVLSVLVASIGYWYVFGAPVAPSGQTVSENAAGAIVEYAAPAQSENYKIETTKAVPALPGVALKPATLNVGVFSTVSVTGAAARLKKQLEIAGFTVTAIGNERPTLPATTIQMKKGTESLSGELLAVVAKHYAVDLIGILDPSSPYDAVVMIGRKSATP